MQVRPKRHEGRRFSARVKNIGVIAIGDEILAGHVQESNAHHVARAVRPMGIRLARVTVCTDEIDDIATTIKAYLGRGVDYIVTSGGLGPTPDDRTMLGVATAFGLPLESTPENEAWMRERVAEGFRRGYFDAAEPNEGLLKMVLLPHGAQAMPNHVGTALGAVVTKGKSTLFTLPGPPEEFARMFSEGVEPRLEQDEPIHTQDVVLGTEESRFFSLLSRLEKEFPDLQIGSYPERGQIRIRATGKKTRAVEAIQVVREAAAEYVRE